MSLFFSPTQSKQNTRVVAFFGMNDSTFLKYFKKLLKSLVGTPVPTYVPVRNLHTSNSIGNVDTIPVPEA